MVECGQLGYGSKKAQQVKSPAVLQAGKMPTGSLPAMCLLPTKRLRVYLMEIHLFLWPKAFLQSFLKM